MLPVSYHSSVIILIILSVIRSIVCVRGTSLLFIKPLPLLHSAQFHSKHDSHRRVGEREKINHSPHDKNCSRLLRLILVAAGLQTLLKTLGNYYSSLGSRVNCF